MRYSIFFSLALFCSSLHAQYRDYPITVTDVYDGDTFTCTIDLGFDTELKNQRVRASNYDAWEVSRIRRTVDITELELIKGKKAREDLKKIFSESTMIWARVHKKKYRDPYGRVLVQVFVTTSELGVNKDLGVVMSELGHVRN